MTNSHETGDTPAWLAELDPSLRKLDDDYAVLHPWRNRAQQVGHCLFTGLQSLALISYPVSCEQYRRAESPGPDNKA